jgi:hypothetical protein
MFDRYHTRSVHPFALIETTDPAPHLMFIEWILVRIGPLHRVHMHVIDHINDWLYGTRCCYIGPHRATPFTILDSETASPQRLSLVQVV